MKDQPRQKKEKTALGVEGNESINWPGSKFRPLKGPFSSHNYKQKIKDDKVTKGQLSS